jgi:hypothetical protein
LTDIRIAVRYDEIMKPAAVRRARELAITDFRFSPSVESVMVDGRGHAYLVYGRRRSLSLDAGDEYVSDEHASELTRGLVECALGMFFGGFVALVLWFGFVSPIRQLAPPASESFVTRTASAGMGAQYCSNAVIELASLCR